MILPESFGFRDCSNRGGQQNELGPRHVGWRCWVFPTEERFSHHPVARALQLITGTEGHTHVIPTQRCCTVPVSVGSPAEDPSRGFCKEANSPCAPGYIRENTGNPAVKRVKVMFLPIKCHILSEPQKPWCIESDLSGRGSCY